MRLIDADALMADLEKWLKQIDPTHPPEDNSIPPMEDIIVSTLMTIEEQPTIDPQRWIPVTERLPENNEEVLTTYIVNGNKNKRYTETATYYDDDEGDWLSPWDEYREAGARIEVIAWMPLPEPYKEGQDD